MSVTAPEKHSASGLAEMSPRGRVIFVNRFFHPDLSATSQMLSDLAFGLAARGHDITVITSRICYEQATAARLPPKESVDGVAIHRVWSTGFGRNGSLGRVVDYASFHLTALAAVLRLARSGDVVVAKTDPPLISVPVAYAARWRGARFVNWLQDLFPEVLQAALGKSPRTWWLDLLRRMRNRSLRSAEANVTVGELMAERAREQGVLSGSVHVIENWSDRDRVRPIESSKNPLRLEWALSRKFVVGYSGNLGVAHESAAMLGAAKLLRGLSEIVFLFVGGGSQHRRLMAAVEKEGLANVQFRHYQPSALLAEALSVPDVHLICLRPEMEGLIVPSKLYGVLAAGRPCIFIGDPAGEVPRVLSASGIGQSVQTDKELATAIRAMALHAERTREMGARARAVFEQRFDRRYAIDKWEDLLRGI